MAEITELENKYVGLFKKEDFDDLEDDEKSMLYWISKRIDKVRWRKSKPPMSDNRYLVLNLDDEIDTRKLRKSIDDAILEVTFRKHEGRLKTVQICDIALALVNAIEIAKERK